MTPVKTVPYLKVLNGISLRWIKAPWTSLTTAQHALAQEAITSAVKRCYDFTWWSEAKQIEEITTVSNVVPWADIQRASRYRVWDAEPYTESSTAREVAVLPVASGLRLTQRSLTSVWVEFMPEAPTFQGIQSIDLIPPAFPSPIIRQTKYYVIATDEVGDIELGRAYVALTDSPSNTPANDENWKELIIYDCMADAVKLLSLADLLGNNEQERLQAADLRSQAEILLNEAYVRSTVIP